MAKRENEDHGSVDAEKKYKSGKKDDIAIDSELLGQQSSYGENAENGTSNTSGNQQNDQAGAQGHDNDDTHESSIAAQAAAAVAAAQDPASAAAAALSSQHHHQQLHQLQQTLAYQNAVRQQQHNHESHSTDSSLSQLSPGSHFATTGPGKPGHGSDEWHKQRRENHKEVERRRRESINLGIKELATLIPTQDTNKAQILLRAVDYIKRLKENENNNIEKWTLEKLLTEQAVSELSASNEKLKQELERTYREIEQWKRIADGKEKK